MTFFGAGYRAAGSGSFSSSSLSPLAMPFKVDKTIPKMNSVNSSVNYPDLLMCGPYFDPTGRFGNLSSPASSVQNLVATELRGISTSCSSSPVVYGDHVSQESTTATGVYHTNSRTVDAYDPFTYDPFSNRMSTSTEEGRKPYCSPFVPSALQKDGYLSLGVDSGHAFDLMSNTSSVHLGSRSSQVDYPEVRHGDCKVNWGSFWGGVVENEQAKWSGYGQGFSSKDSTAPNLSSSNIPFLLDESNKSRSSNDANTHPFADGTCNVHFPGNGGNMSILKQDGSFDISGGTYHHGSLAINWQDSISTVDCSRKPTSAPVSISKGSFHIPEPLLESVADICDTQKANASSPGDHFSQNGFYVFGCSPTTSINPATMFKPYVDSSSFPESSLLALKQNPRSSAASVKSSGSAGYNSACQIEPKAPDRLKQQPSIVIRRPVSSVMPSARKMEEVVDSPFQGKNASGKVQISAHRIQQCSSESFNLEFNDAQAEFSAEKKPGWTDVLNPAEDSPCWRGASKRFSPFEVSEGNYPGAPDCKSLRPQEPEFQSLLVDTRDSRNSIFTKGIQSKDNEEKSSSTQNPLRFDLNAVGGVQFDYETCLSTEECDTSNKLKSVLYPGITLDSHPPLGPAQNLWSKARSESAASEESENDRPVGTVISSGLPLGIDSQYENSTAEDNACARQCQSSKITDANTDANELLKTMTKLSEIFRSYSFGNGVGLPEQHAIAIKHIIANLNASLLMLVGETIPTMVSPQATSSEKELPAALTVKDAEAVTAAVKVTGMGEGLLDSVSLKDDAIPDADMTEALKDILQVNLQEEEETFQHKLLYKTLWLEAEASLCVMTAKARFLRVKAQLEKAAGGAKDVQGTVGLVTVDNILSDASENIEPSVVGQANHFEIPYLCKEYTPIPITDDTNSLIFEGPKARNQDICFPPPLATGPGIIGIGVDGPGTTRHNTDEEASVMSRYQILKNRVENSEGLSCEREQPSRGYDNASSLSLPGYDSHGADIVCKLNRAESPVLARYQILKDRVNHILLDDECSQSLEEANYLADGDSSSPKYQILDGGADKSDSLYEGGDSSTQDEQVHNSPSLTNPVGVPDEGEASVMARFRIIQSRISHSNSANRNRTFVHTNKEAVEYDGAGLSKQQSNVSMYTFGPYPDLSVEKDAHQSGFCVDTGPFSTQHCKIPRLSPEIFETWYTDCPSSDWEHVSGDDPRRSS